MGTRPGYDEEYDTWRSPELIAEASNGPCASLPGDVWALGYLVVSMMAGFEVASKVGSVSSDSNRPPLMADHLSPRVCALVRRCMCANPSQRASVADMLGDPWLSQYAPRLQLGLPYRTHYVS